MFKRESGTSASSACAGRIPTWRCVKQSTVTFHAGALTFLVIVVSSVRGQSRLVIVLDSKHVRPANRLRRSHPRLVVITVHLDVIPAPVLAVRRIPCPTQSNPSFHVVKAAPARNRFVLHYS